MLNQFLLNPMMYTRPLLAMMQNGAPFHLCPLHQIRFDMIKWICEKAPVIQPIELTNKEPIWLICDASKSGAGVMYGQGLTWQDF